LSSYSIPLGVIVSEDGLITDVNTQYGKFTINISSELPELNNLIQDELERLSKIAPIAKPARIGGRKVSYLYRIVLTFHADQFTYRQQPSSNSIFLLSCNSIFTKK
jgi:hypothetical protein